MPGESSRERLLARVEKLLALAGSDNPHEAGAAAAAAQRLIERHAISEAELDAARVGRAHDGHEPLAVVEREGYEWWLDKLAKTVADATGCCPFREERRGDEGPIAIRVAGSDADVALCRTLFAWCRVEVERIAAAVPESLSPDFRRGVPMGAVDRIQAEIAEERRRTQDELAREFSPRALAVIDRRADEARRAAGAGLRASRVEIEVGRGGWLHGYAAARDVYTRGRRGRIG